MAYIIDDLISATKSVPQVHPLWKARVAEDVLTPFFACFIANLSDMQMQAWYENFVTKTAFAYDHAKASGGALTGSALYWQNPIHAKLAYCISRATLVDKTLFKAIFPIVTHMGYNLLQKQATEKDVALQAYASAYLDEVADFLPDWAKEVVAKETLEQISNAHRFFDDAEPDKENDLTFNLPEPSAYVSTRQALAQLDSRLESLIDDDQTLDVNLTLDDDVIDTSGDQFSSTIDDDNTQNALTFDFDEPPISSADTTDDDKITQEKSDTSHNDQKDQEDVLSVDDDLLDDIRLVIADDTTDTKIPASTDDVSEYTDNHQDDDISNHDKHDGDDDHNDVYHDHDDNDKNDDNNDNDQTHDTADDVGDQVLPALHKTAGKSKRLTAVLLFLFLLVAAGAGGFWFYQNQIKKSIPEIQSVAQATQPAPAVVSLPPSSLSITVGQAGELYACQAEVGNHALADRLNALLNISFSNALCVIDINSNLSQEMLANETLVSVVALLKSSPYANFELLGNHLWIHAPNQQDVARLVRDIGAITASYQIQVLPRPPLDVATEIGRSLEKADTAMNTLAQNADDYALARVLSTAIFDMQDGAVPQTHWQLLQKAAEYLKQRPDTRLIIVAHRDEIGDGLAARNETQLHAQAIKNKLMEFGVLESQLFAQGVGFDFPVMDNQTELGRFKNRRIEFLVYDEAIMQALSRPMTVPDPLPTPMTGGVNVGADILPEPEMTMPLAPSVPVNPPQPIYGVDNGQIVEYGMPQVGDVIPPPNTVPPPMPKPETSSPSMPIDEELLRPIQVYPANGQGSQVH